MMHGVPFASPLAGVFVRALARAPLGVRMRVCVRARMSIKAVRPLAAAVHAQSSV
jgi:hypothetical protein